MKDVVLFVSQFLWIFGEFIENVEWHSLRDIWHRSNEEMDILDHLNVFGHNLMTINGIECDLGQINNPWHKMQLDSTFCNQQQQQKKRPIPIFRLG